MPVKSRTIKNHVYKFVHKHDENLRTNIKGIQYKHKDEWLEIYEDGTIQINASCMDGYAWDGCTPKWEFLDLLFGIPDGSLDYTTEKPLTYYASMVHDILYQFKDEVPISRKTADKLFCIIMKDAGFMWWWLYYFAVRLCGGFFGKWKHNKEVMDIEIFGCSWKEEMKNNE